MHARADSRPSTFRVPGALHLRVDDLDELRVWADADSGPHSLVVQGRGPLGFELTAAPGAAVSVARARASLELRVRGSTPNVCLHVPEVGSYRYAFGRQVHDVGPGAAILLPTRWEHARCGGATGAFSALALDDAAWQREIRARHPNPGPDDALHPARLELASPALRGLRSSIDALFKAATEPDAPPARRALLEAAFVEALAGALWRQSAWTPVPAVAARRVAELEGWIDAHLEGPLTLGRLCAVAGVGGRSLQQAFLSRRGMSPMRFVVERRLHRAHARLSGSGRRDSVSAVALECGFAHLGRFGTLYREVYGESPSQTLRRGR
ncbi:MAG: AraC family transcriptional regulator [Burkholderiales bacterium]|nr:AraC family transcriptional regulator [Burkholderiales bacterium]